MARRDSGMAPEPPVARSISSALASRRRETSFLAAAASLVVDEPAGPLGLDLLELVAIDGKRPGGGGALPPRRTRERHQHGGKDRCGHDGEGDPQKHALLVPGRGQIPRPTRRLDRNVMGEGSDPGAHCNRTGDAGWQEQVGDRASMSRDRRMKSPQRWAGARAIHRAMYAFGVRPGGSDTRQPTWVQVPSGLRQAVPRMVCGRPSM